MNKERRKKVLNAIRNIEDVLQDILSDEQEAYDNMPEGLQSSENGMVSEEAQENLNKNNFDKIKKFIGDEDVPMQNDGASDEYYNNKNNGFIS